MALKNTEENFIYKKSHLQQRRVQEIMLKRQLSAVKNKERKKWGEKIILASKAQFNSVIHTYSKKIKIEKDKVKKDVYE